MPSETGTSWTIVVAAGTGTRFGGNTPKQFVEIAGRRVVDWSVSAAASVCAGIVVVLPPGCRTELGSDSGCVVLTVDGGSTRSESVRRGLDAIPADVDTVLVHDAARPVASAALFRRVVQAVSDGADGVVPVVDVVDTIQDVEGAAVDRSVLRAVQTPQGFSAAALRRAHASGADATDDATLVRAVGGAVVTVPGERWNIKVTEPDDERVVAALLEGRR